MAVPFMKFTTRKWAVLTSKIDKLFIVIGINCVVLISDNQLLRIEEALRPEATCQTGLF